MTDQAPAPADILRRARPIPTYRDHPAAVGHDVVGVDPSGTGRAVRIEGATEPVCLLFLSSSCLGCADLWEGLGTLGRVLGAGVRVVVVTRGPEVEDAAAIARLAASGGGEGEGSEVPVVDVVMSSQAFLDYGVGGPPFYVVAVGREVRSEGVAWGVSETAEVVRRALTGLDGP